MHRNPASTISSALPVKHRRRCTSFVKRTSGVRLPPPAPIQHGAFVQGPGRLIVNQEVTSSSLVRTARLGMAQRSAYSAWNRVVGSSNLSAQTEHGSDPAG
jgi:hypothetical protein